MLYSKVFALGAFATTVLADAASIGAAMTKIQSATNALDKVVTQWDGNLFGSIPIVVKSTALLKDINDGKKVAEDSEALDINGALTIATSTLALSKDVVKSLDDIVAAKKKFDHLLLSPAILVSLDLLKCATDDFSTAVVSKVPDALKATAESLIKPIDDGFSSAIKAYKLF